MRRSLRAEELHRVRRDPGPRATKGSDRATRPLVAASRSLRVQDAVSAAGLAALAVALRIGPLGPSSLWVDDTWSALPGKVTGLHDLWVTGVTAPGFAGLFRAWTDVVGFSEVRAQLLPFALGVATLPLLYLVLVRRGVHRFAAAAAAFLLASSSVHAAFSLRVKQFTLDGVCSTIVLAASWWLLEDVRSPRRWWTLAALGITMTALSTPTGIVLACSVGVALLVYLRRSRRLSVAPLAASGLAVAFGAAWWVVVLRPRVTDSLDTFWNGFYISLGDGPGTAVRDTSRAVSHLAGGAVGLPRFLALAVLVIAAAIVLWRRLPLGLLLLAPVAAAVVLAALKAAPLGTRTDIYLYPALVMILAVAVHELLTLAPRPAAASALVLCVVSAVTFTSPVYPKADVRPLVSEVEAKATSSDAILVLPQTSYAFGLYTNWPIAIVENPRPYTGFDVRVARPNVLLLGSCADVRCRPYEPYSRTIAQVAPLHRRVWLLASWGDTQLNLPPVERLLERQGYTRDLTVPRRGAVLERWSRSLPPVPEVGSATASAGPAPSTDRRRAGSESTTRKGAT